MNPGDSDDEDEDRENLVGEIEDSGSIFSNQIESYQAVRDIPPPLQTRNEFTYSRITYVNKIVFLYEFLNYSSIKLLFNITEMCKYVGVYDFL